MKNLIQLLKLIRIPNLAIIAITQLMAARFLIEGNSFYSIAHDYHLYLLIFSTILIASGGYIINDYYDIKIDYVNKPDRVVIGKHIKRRQVLIIHSIFNFTAIGLGALVSWWIMGLNMVAAFLLWLYSNLLKRLALWGNITVSLLTALSVFSVYLVYFKNLDFIMMYAVFAFFISLIREIVKDMEDMEGDAKFGCRTLPIVAGIFTTKIILYGLSFTFFLITVMITKNWSWFLHSIGLLALILVFLSIRIYAADKKNDYSKISKIAKLIMIAGISSMMLL